MNCSFAIQQVGPLATFLVDRLCSDAVLVVARHGPAASLATRSWRAVLARGWRRRARRFGFRCRRLGRGEGRRICALECHGSEVVSRSSAPTSNNSLHRSPRAVCGAAYALVGRRCSLHLRGCVVGGAGELKRRYVQEAIGRRR